MRHCATFSIFHSFLIESQPFTSYHELFQPIIHMIKLHQEKTVIFSMTDRYTHLLIISYVICTSPLCHSDVIECHLNITPMCLYVIPVPLLCSRVSFVCQLYVLVCHLNASHMGSFVILMSLVCTSILIVFCGFACHYYVTGMSLLYPFYVLVYHRILTYF